MGQIQQKMNQKMIQMIQKICYDSFTSINNLQGWVSMSHKYIWARQPTSAELKEF
jgi:hypothetical protein